MPYADPDVAREKAAERNRLFRKRHPNASRDAQRRRRAKRPQECKDIGRDRRYRQLYGISLEQFREMEAAQGNRCAICDGPPANGQSLHVDHDHDTGVVRELLCNTCNVAIAFMNETPWKFRAALRYLAKHKEIKVMTTEKKEAG